MTEKLTQEKFNTMLINSGLEIKTYNKYKNCFGETIVEIALVIDDMIFSETTITLTD